MELKDIWNDLCYRINCKNQNVPERGFQIITESLFEKLGWSISRHEIITQKAIPVGASGNIKPDIVISDNEKKLFVIELKKPNISMSGRNSEQLFSYMRLLRLNFGILIGETLQAYYEVSIDDEFPRKIIEIHFNQDSEDGINFIKLLSRNEYSPDDIESYCKQRIELEAENEKSRQYIDDLCSEKGARIIINLLKEKLSTNFSQNITESIINSININISRIRTGISIPQSDSDGNGSYHTPPKKPKDKTKYLLNGHPVGGKGALVRAVVRLYIEQNPNTTFEELADKFPHELNKTKFGMFNTYDKAIKINANEAASRYNINEPVKLINGGKIAICTQWHPGNIAGFIRRAEELGFNIVAQKRFKPC